MSVKKIKEWFVNAAWGKVAVISWGDPARPPVLLVHGYMDSAATFIRIVELLSDDYYYVAFDSPGHGKSDPLPGGPLVTQTVVVETINRIVTSMRWRSFVVLTHSMGYVIAAFYNHIYPGKMSGAVNIDPVPGIANYYYMNESLRHWFEFYYKDYYDNYKKYNGRTRLYTLDQAKKLLMDNRSFTEEQATVVLSRALEPAGDGLYRLTWQPIVKKLLQFPVFEDTLKAVLSNPPPTLNFVARTSTEPPEAKTFAMDILHSMENDQHSIVYVDGAHDVHITNPERLAPFIVEFLHRESNSKLNAKL